MQNSTSTKSFAFKLADRPDQKQAQPAQQWKVRDGVSVAGCTGPDPRGSDYWRGEDAGIIC